MTKQQELDALARFAGLKQWRSYQGTLENFYVNEKGRQYRTLLQWNPYENWNHLRLVLEALVKYEQQRLSKMHGPQSWGNMGWDHVSYGLKSRVFHKRDEPFDLGEAVCSMALTIAKSRTARSEQEKEKPA